MPKGAPTDLGKSDKTEICDLYREGKSVAALARQFAIGQTRVRSILKEHGVALRSRSQSPAHTEPPADDQMNVGSAATEGLPELIVSVAAAPEPIADEAALELGRTRARDLHATTSRVVAVQELPTLSRSVLARQQYEAPRILESGSVVDVANPHAAAKLVEGLVARLNEVPGFQAYFEWRSQGAVGQPLAR